MKKGDFVEIKIDAFYPGQDINWTELCTGKKNLKEGTVLYHCSDIKIKAFFPKVTCFFTDNRGSGHIYKITLLRDVWAEEYGAEEVRFKLETNSVKIKYLGWRGRSKKTKFKYKDYTISETIL